MNTHSKMIRFTGVMVTTLLAIVSTAGLRAQGTITFNDPWADDGLGTFSLNYYSGISFRIGPYPPPQPPFFDDVMIVGAKGPSGYPHNGTPYIAFVNTYGTPQYVAFALTNAASRGQSFTNGAPIGLISVDLADPETPSPTQVSITFNGFKADGAMVSQTFITPGGGATTFQTYSFGPDFASGLVRVEIPSLAWAMDNIRFVPEPGVGSLLLLGLLALNWRAARKRCC
jgi:hypothetical protein